MPRATPLALSTPACMWRHTCTRSCWRALAQATSALVRCVLARRAVRQRAVWLRARAARPARIQTPSEMGPKSSEMGSEMGPVL